ncbi:3-hexulose-6-phosphate synthase [Methanonatronarchaeum sp. AMET-Sl]|uniref:3-hexulose-6-phosphate synthase n=1 Tax=Methanonatronarchaeum sp. AMET-Sl TaxID=3037654 RepID=UPI00244E2168|nr:3-hexulose-6-phosphate synthase [Methanonatronarchaeum sp. AMET-Sl]WGI18130.1 orotidine 5'-phosphate decarboxylase [Methanonatronarchaeum sp. AMET-Sl]
MTKIQVAIDVTELQTALEIAEQSIKGGADWIEAGTPLIKSQGLKSIQKLKQKHPEKTVVADMKTMDTGSLEVEIAAKKGADIISILGSAADKTIEDAIKKSREYGTKIMTDLINTKNPVQRAIELKKLGTDIILVHTGIDQQMAGSNPLNTLHQVTNQIKNTPIAVAGGLDKKTAPKAAKKANIIIIGGAITRSNNIQKSTREIKNAIQNTTQKTPQTTTTKPKPNKITTCNLADALNNKGIINKIKHISGEKTHGRALTVKTMNGDWSKPVQAIDQAQKGDIIVIDASGGDKAVWGELATRSAINNQIKGVIINGGIRDIKEIKQLEFPAWAKHTTPQAGKPRGHGEIGTKIQIQNTTIETGDYIYADQNGAIAIKKQETNYILNKAKLIKENEDRVRSQIKKGKTLSKTIELKKWEKK